MRIALDVDGVFADFVLSFTQVLHEINGSSIYGTEDQREWKFEGTSAEYNKAWRFIDDCMNWWMTLEPLVSTSDIATLNTVAKKNTIFFVTSRRSLNPTAGLPVEEQTAGWLKGIGVAHTPKVIATKSSSKAALINALDIDFFLDDKPTILEDARKNCPDTLVSAIDWCYNREVEVDARYLSVGKALKAWA